ncbi:RNA methyltransferase [Canibacter sp. lx-45]|uniref:TrmH family RNA methyltransferase n=1 Tax=Canibacter zhuwentaonis TaxID=2837491 RepID=UPI001BDD594C|nr:RNA methyltransferase [Canibacter zhuwentaonis]
MIDNPKAEQIRKARQLLRKKERLQQNKFLVEGPHAVTELLSASVGVPLVIYITLAARAARPLLGRLADKRRVRVETVTEQVIAELSDTVTPQGVVAIAEIQNATLAKIFTPAASLVAVLHGVQDPGNAGTVLRVADASGADGVIFTGAGVDPWHPKVLRATTGSIFHLPVAAVGDIDTVLHSATQAGLITVATDLAGADLNPTDQLFKNPVCWVFGNEAQGLDRSAREKCETSRKLPIYGAAESLNIATAASVCLYISAFGRRSGS